MPHEGDILHEVMNGRAMDVELALIFKKSMGRSCMWPCPPLTQLISPPPWSCHDNTVGRAVRFWGRKLTSKPW